MITWREMCCGMVRTNLLTTLMTRAARQKGLERSRLQQRVQIQWLLDKAPEFSPFPALAANSCRRLLYAVASRSAYR